MITSRANHRTMSQPLHSMSSTSPELQEPHSRMFVIVMPYATTNTHPDQVSMALRRYSCNESLILNAVFC